MPGRTFPKRLEGTFRTGWSDLTKIRKYHAAHLNGGNDDGGERRNWAVRERPEVGGICGGRSVRSRVPEIQVGQNRTKWPWCLHQQTGLDAPGIVCRRRVNNPVWEITKACHETGGVVCLSQSIIRTSKPRTVSGDITRPFLACTPPEKSRSWASLHPYTSS